MTRPVVELSVCIRCEVCMAVCPAVFRLNDAGFIEIAELPGYPEDAVEEAIKNCPGKCISWDKLRSEGIAGAGLCWRSRDKG